MVIRTCRIRHLCRALAAVDDIDIDVIKPSETDNVIGREQFNGPEEEAVDPQMELEVRGVNFLQRYFVFYCVRLSFSYYNILFYF